MNTKKIIGIIVILVGIAVLAVLNWNVLQLDLPSWSNIPAFIIGIPFVIWGFRLIIIKE